MSRPSRVAPEWRFKKGKPPHWPWPAGPLGRCTSTRGCSVQALDGRWVCGTHAAALEARAEERRERHARRLSGEG